MQLIEDGREPFLPEALRSYRRWQKFGNTWSGGLMNQPHIQLMEFEVIESAINEYNVIKFIQAQASRPPSVIGGNNG